MVGAGGVRRKGVSLWRAYLSCNGAGVTTLGLLVAKWHPSTPLACLPSHQRVAGRIEVIVVGRGSNARMVQLA
jgi:hypothetical protein